MPWEINFDFYGEEQVNRTLLRTADHIGDPEPALRGVADYLRGIEKRQFSSQGAQSGHPWKPLAASTIKRKGHARIMELTGRLFKSLTSKTDPEHFEIITDEGMWWGSMVPYGIYHQKGSLVQRAEGHHLPMRKLIDLTEHQRREVVRKIQRFIMTGVAT